MSQHHTNLMPGVSLSRPTLTRRRRAFTLVELMVTLTASLFFVIFVFALSRNASKFFQSQVQLSDSTISVITGFERLRSDIARAGFLASPNLAKDANHCPRPDPGVAVAPAKYAGYLGLQQMALARIIQGAGPAGNVMLNNNAGGISPDQLVLYGNYTSADDFPVRSANWGGTPTIVLEPESNALFRIGIQGTGSATEQSILDQTFRVGSIIRMMDETGRDQYSIVSATTFVTLGGDSAPQITLTGPAVTQISDGGSCGMRGLSAGVTVSPVDIVRYELADVVSDPSKYPHLAYLYGGTAPSYDSTRLDLIRYELPANIDNSTVATPAMMQSAEIVAEYAVDLGFGLTVFDNPTAPALRYIPEGDLEILNYAGPIGTSGGNNLGPHFIRGIHARLAVRSRVADSKRPLLTNPDAATSDQLFRVRLTPGTSNDPGEYATVRTLRSHIATRNTRNLMWN